MEKIIIFIGVILVLTPIQFFFMRPIIKPDWRNIAKERVESLKNAQVEASSDASKAFSDQKIIENLLSESEILKESNDKGFLLFVVACLISGLILLVLGFKGINKKNTNKKTAKAESKKLRAIEPLGVRLAKEGNLNITFDSVDSKSKQELLKKLIESLVIAEVPANVIKIKLIMHPPIETPMEVKNIHKLWRPETVQNIKTPEKLVRLDSTSVCPIGSTLVEVDFIARQSGGMGSFFGYDGYFLSMIVSSDLLTALDFRGEAAS